MASYSRYSRFHRPSECHSWRASFLGYGSIEIAIDAGNSAAGLLPEIGILDSSYQRSRTFQRMQNALAFQCRHQPSPDVLMRPTSRVSGRCLFPQVHAPFDADDPPRLAGITGESMSCQHQCQVVATLMEWIDPLGSRSPAAGITSCGLA